MVIPVGDINPTRRTPFVTVAFLAANIVAFVVLQPKGQTCEAAAFLYEWAAVPRELLGFEQLDPTQLREVIGGCAGQVGEKSVLLSAVTAMFLHGGWFHLLGNMLYLWVFGNNVEDRLGHGRFVFFYVVGGLAATYTFAVLNPGSSEVLVGASGAIAAILGAYLVLYPRAGVHTYVPFPLYLAAAIIPGARIRGWFLIFAIVTLPAWLVLGLWFVLQVMSSGATVTGGGVAYEAHVAGFAAGIVLLLLLDRRRARRGRTPFHEPLRRRR
ncbi:MAG: rhomboid family intramembrane serine protease [Nitriliruptorales bacterium]|nr:rhomboid family intramembrane serine protease [Nitriliruptorales bacterium]